MRLKAQSCLWCSPPESPESPDYDGVCVQCAARLTVKARLLRDRRKNARRASEEAFQNWCAVKFIRELEKSPCMCGSTALRGGVVVTCMAHATAEVA